MSLGRRIASLKEGDLVHLSFNLLVDLNCLIPLVSKLCHRVYEPSKMESLLGLSLYSKGGPVETRSLESRGSVVALYFSAHWCPPCRGFTPKVRVVELRLLCWG